MYIYLGIIIFTIAIVSLYDITKKKSFYIFSTIILSVFSGIRYMVGTDYQNYMIMFRNAKNITLTNYDSDIGFLLLIKLISYFTDNYRIHFFIISTFIVSSVMIFIYKTSKIKFLSVALYLSLGMYFSSFNILRQWLAIAIAIWAIYLINSKKNLLFYILVIIASSMHITALIILPMKFILEVNWSKITYFFITFILLIIYISPNVLMNIFNNNERIYGYYNGYYTNNGANPIFMIVYLTIFMFCIFYINKIENKINNKYLKLMFLGLMFIILGTRGLIFSRLAAYFNIGILVCIPMIIKNLKLNEKNLIGYVVIVCLIIYANVYIVSQGGLIPYRII